MDTKGTFLLRLTTYVALSIVGMGLAGCGPTEKEPYSPSPENSLIVGGTLVGSQSEVAKMTVGVVIRGGGTCTGSIITKSHVITAAHCATDFMLRPLRATDLAIVFATDFNSSQRIIRRVSSVKVHPSWRMNSNNEKNTGDIAILKLSAEIPAGYKPATLLEDSSKLKAGEKTHLAGYGITSSAGMGSGVLREVDALISDPNFSQTEVKLDQRSGLGACHGDSGGPAYIKVNNGYQLYGVTSRGVDDDQDTCLRFSAYTNILAYKTWVSQVLLQ